MIVVSAAAVVAHPLYTEWTVAPATAGCAHGAPPPEVVAMAVAPRPLADQSPVPSSLLARTCTSWVVPVLSDAIVVMVVTPSYDASVQATSPEARHCTS